MLLPDILKKFAIDENNKELEYLVIYFAKESVMDMASDIAKACDKVYDDIPDEYSNLVIAKFLGHLENLHSSNHFSSLSYEFDSDVEFLAELLGVDKEFLLDTVTDFAVDYLKYHNIKLEEDN